mmetsp:Transcript_56932/g.173333  ORF Transcript_56932/g.173333 Transcript_56932/m.173333 type:complete len:287 (-) Transcript_56932:173-1033(-)
MVSTSSCPATGKRPRSHWETMVFFVALPTPKSRQLFQRIEQEFMKSHEWDQTLFQRYLQADDGPTLVFLSLSSYASMMLYHNKDRALVEPPKGLVAMHATCLEGALNKLFAVEATVGILPVTKAAVNKTVTWHADLMSIASSVAGFSEALRPLVQVALRTGRAIRVRASKPWSIFSADFLGSLGVRVVPAGFWGTAHPDVATVTSEADAVLSSAAEVQMQISLAEPVQEKPLVHSGEPLPRLAEPIEETPFVHNGEPLPRPFTCKLLKGLPVKEGDCLQTCDGKHF